MQDKIQPGSPDAIILDEMIRLSEGYKASESTILDAIKSTRSPQVPVPEDDSRLKNLFRSLLFTASSALGSPQTAAQNAGLVAQRKKELADAQARAREINLVQQGYTERRKQQLADMLSETRERAADRGSSLRVALAELKEARDRAARERDFRMDEANKEHDFRMEEARVRKEPSGGNGNEKMPEADKLWLEGGGLIEVIGLASQVRAGLVTDEELLEQQERLLDSIAVLSPSLQERIGGIMDRAITFRDAKAAATQKIVEPPAPTNPTKAAPQAYDRYGRPSSVGPGVGIRDILPGLDPKNRPEPLISSGDAARFGVNGDLADLKRNFARVFGEPGGRLGFGPSVGIASEEEMDVLTALNDAINPSLALPDSVDLFDPVRNAQRSVNAAIADSLSTRR